MTAARRRRNPKSKPAEAASFRWDDPLLLTSSSTDDERMIRDTARAYAQDKLHAAGDRGLPRGEDRPVDLQRDGRARASRRDDPGGIRRRRRLLRRLRARGARGRARRFRLPLDDERAVLARHVPDLRLWRRDAAQEVPAEARLGRVGRLLRPDRARCRLRPRRHEDPRREDRRRLPAHRLEDVDLELAHRRRVRRLGEVGGARQPDPRLRAREGHEGPLGAEDRRQALAARLDHRRDRDGRRRGRRGRAAAERLGAQRPVRLPQPGPLRHRLGRHGRGRVLLARGAAVHARPQAVRPPARADAARAEEARRHADRDRARPPGRAARRAPLRRGQARARDDLAGQAQQLRQGARHRPRRPATCTAATASRRSTTSCASRRTSRP